MYIRLTHIRYTVEHEQEVLQLARECLLPLLHQLPGFRGVLVAADRQRPGSGMVLSRWESEAQAEGLHDALSLLAGPLRLLGIEPGTACTCEVVVLDEHTRERQ